MIGNSKDNSFLRRTARRAEQENNMNIQEPVRQILPRFWSKSFLFLDDEKPEHIEVYPYIGSYTPNFEVHGITHGGKEYYVAVDIQEYAVAALLARARVRHQEQSIALYGYTDSVDIKHPDDTYEVFYTGRTS